MERDVIQNNLTEKELTDRYWAHFDAAVITDFLGTGPMLWSYMVRLGSWKHPDDPEKAKAWTHRNWPHYIAGILKPPLFAPLVTTSNIRRMLDTDIRSIGLSVRVMKNLFRKNITTVGRLMFCSRSDLLRIHGIGKKALDEISEKLAKQLTVMGRDVREQEDAT